MYSTVATSLFSTWTSLVAANGSKDKTDRAMSSFVLYQRKLRSLERVAGISLSTVVDKTGKVIRRAPSDPDSVMLASERCRLDGRNSLPLSDLLTHTAKKVSRSNGKPKTSSQPTTCPTGRGWATISEPVDEELLTLTIKAMTKPIPPTDAGYIDTGYDPYSDPNFFADSWRTLQPTMRSVDVSCHARHLISPAQSPVRKRGSLDRQVTTKQPKAVNLPTSLAPQVSGNGSCGTDVQVPSRQVGLGGPGPTLYIPSSSSNKSSISSSSNSKGSDGVEECRLARAENRSVPALGGSSDAAPATTLDPSRELGMLTVSQRQVSVPVDGQELCVANHTTTGSSFETISASTSIHAGGELPHLPFCV